MLKKLIQVRKPQKKLKKRLEDISRSIDRSPPLLATFQDFSKQQLRDIIQIQESQLIQNRLKINHKLNVLKQLNKRQHETQPNRQLLNRLNQQIQCIQKRKQTISDLVQHNDDIVALLRLQQRRDQLKIQNSLLKKQMLKLQRQLLHTSW